MTHLTSSGDFCGPLIKRINKRIREKQTKKGAMLPWHPFACSMSVNRLPAIALSTGTTATAATKSAAGTSFLRFRFVDG
jgi:hypothetical protein